VLAYPKFKLTNIEIRGLIEEELLPFIETVNVPPLIAPKIRDPDDAKFITCAATAGVRWLVSGDNDLLSLHRVKSVEILSVTAFLQHLKSKP
jgi:predicted nucleic acid-binding protein